MNVKVVLEYDGSGFHGWQAQAGKRTVEGEVRAALRELTGRDLIVYGAGRTDAGAHALGQVANFHYDGRLTPQRVQRALNALLPADVCVVDAQQVYLAFHARHSACWRHYRYRWLDRATRPAIGRSQVWHVPRRLDEVAMSEAAEALVGLHDWTTFCSASEPGNRRSRRLRQSTITRTGDLVDLDLVGDGFLRGMVRGVAGALTVVGLGRQPPRWVGDALAARDRSKAATTAPAHGLTLVRVLYEEAGTA